jgi:hypothetical protein
MTYVYYAALAIVMGVAVSVYLPMQVNGGRILGAPALFNAVFFFFGMVTSAVIFFATGGKFAVLGGSRKSRPGFISQASSPG